MKHGRNGPAEADPALVEGREERRTWRGALGF
jgi:hypothetical protein